MLYDSEQPNILFSGQDEAVFVLNKHVYLQTTTNSVYLYGCRPLESRGLE